MVANHDVRPFRVFRFNELNSRLVRYRYRNVSALAKGRQCSRIAPRTITTTNSHGQVFAAIFPPLRTVASPASNTLPHFEHFISSVVTQETCVLGLGMSGYMQR
jgi:hypothetical protein